MKKLPFIVLCAVVMTGCSEKTDISDYASSEISETTSETTEISTIPTTTQPKKIATKNGFRVTDKGIEVIRNGEIFQVLDDTNIWEETGEISNSEFKPEDYLVKKDYDSDSCSDLFVPYLFSDEHKGVYYHFNPDTIMYEKWDAFNEIGIELEKAVLKKSMFKRYPYNETALYFSAPAENGDIYYCFNGEELKYTGYSLNYSENGDNYTDTFYLHPVTNEEQLVCRIRKNGYTEEEIFVHPNQCFALTCKDYIDVMWWEKSGTIQTIDGDYRVDKEPKGHCTPPKSNASMKDMDGDGYDDIYIEEGEYAGDYFRFNPDTFRFDERTEVSATENDISIDNLDVVHSDMNFHGLSEPPYYIHHLENEDIYYQLNDNNLYYMGKIIRYMGDDGLNYTDTYFQFNKGEQLICRKQIIDNIEKEIFVHPCQCYIPNYKNDIFGIYLKENGELIQTIECDYQFYDRNFTPPKPCFIFKDVNNDGYSDIYIEEGENAGKYFCFNPETFRFDEV